MRKISNNKGFSLIELIVVMAVMVIIGGCIYGFVSASTRSYNSVSKDVDLQEEAQLAMNQLTSILMNAQDGVSYDDSTKTLYIYNDENRYKIAKGTDDSLYYSVEERKKSETTGEFTTDFIASTDQALMAEFLKDFSVVVDDSASTIVVNVTMAFEKAKNSYSTTQKIALRNSAIKNSSDMSVVYDGSSDATKKSVTATYTGMIVKLGTNRFTVGSAESCIVNLTDDNDKVLSLSVVIKGAHFPSQSYQAVLTGSSITDPDTQSRVEGGSVIISKNEGNPLTLTVISTASPSLQCVVPINVKKLTGVTISSNISDPTKAFRPGATLTLGTTNASQLYAVVEGKGDLTEDDKKVTWTAGENCTISGDRLTIVDDESKAGQKFTVTATLVKTNESATFSGIIYSTKASLNLTADSGTVGRGGSVQLTADDGDGNAYESGKVRYSVTVSPSSGSSAVSVSQNGLLTVSPDLDYNGAYKITVKASLTGQSGVTSSVDVNVPAVSLTYALSENGAFSNKITIPMRNLKQDDSYTIYYRIEGISDASVSGITWKQKSTEQTTFKKTVDINASTITFNKVDKDIDGAKYVYDSTYFTLTGTPVVNDTAITSSPITVINKEETTNITISVLESDGTYKPYKYYIPAEETSGYVKLQGTDIEYRVTGYNLDTKKKHWMLEIKKSDSVQYENTKYISYGSGWNVSQ
jgi:prepilin-type N-terminal cleavage/methylation domain-containing protein